jgi:hypothetical protein
MMQPSATMKIVGNAHVGLIVERQPQWTGSHDRGPGRGLL